MEAQCAWCKTEQTTARRLEPEQPRECPFCDHIFRGNGWDGIDAHWRSRHEQEGGPYEEFWTLLCPYHRNHSRALPTTVNPARVRYIKLGPGGAWERECLQRGIVRIGFGTANPERFQLSRSRRWQELTASFIAEGKDKGTATRFTNELQLFFEDDGTILWITFMNERLYWGMTDKAAPEPHADGAGVWRTIRGGWRGTDVNGNPLSKDRLSGAVTKLAAYRGTSCDVDVAEYVVRRINGLKMLVVERALAALHEMRSSVLVLIQLLRPQDFELLVDLVFTTTGWRRVGRVGGTQDTLDLDLILPSTGERAFVQVKSKTTSAELADYVAKLGERADLYSRMFYVYHSGEPSPPDDRRVTLIGPEQLATLVVDAGLAGWLIEKVS